MRHLPHLLITVALGLLAFTLFRAETARRAEGAVQDQAARALARIQREVMVRSVLDQKGTARTRTWPTTIDPEWFGDDLPGNPLLGPDHPWLEIAEVRDRGRRHPRDLQAIDESAAGFWYNPARGIVRIRVPASVSDRASLELYNRLNGTDVQELWPKE